ncbi:hypothetical protein ACL1JB_08050, partial [Corynebacterium striatum]
MTLLAWVKVWRSFRPISHNYPHATPVLTRSATGINVSHVRKKETGTKPVQTGKESEMTTLTYSAELEL